MQGMTTLDIGNKLVALVRAGQGQEAIETLYAADIVSVEAMAPPGGSRETTGVAACLAKGKHWREANELHGAKVEGPFPHGDRFAAVLTYDITPRASGKRTTLAEVAVYTVKNDKIVREEFFYQM